MRQALDSGTVHVGVTGDELLASKAHRDLIQPYAVRAGAARRFLQATRRAPLRMEVGALGRSPPSAATIAVGRCRLNPG